MANAPKNAIDAVFAELGEFGERRKGKKSSPSTALVA
jgi:hypothetical protein